MQGAMLSWRLEPHRALGGEVQAPARSQLPHVP